MGEDQYRHETDAKTVNGWLALLIVCALLAFGAFFICGGFVHNEPSALASGAGLVAFGLLCTKGFFTLQPNEGAVMIFFGDYAGTARTSGFHWVNPFYVRRRLSLRAHNLTTPILKVNDERGNPIEIGAVVVWRVADSAQATFNVDDYKTFVANQSDIAIRSLAAHYPYDSETETSLRGNIDEVAQKLQQALQEKLAIAGIVIEETRLSHLAYASEIAVAMLKRQQAVAIFQARRYMVENALAIIDEVVQHFDAREGVNISDDKKAELINSLLIVMTSDKETSPVLSISK